ncbi:MAG: DUF3450 family protein [Pseudomonadota bacterium]
MPDRFTAPARRWSKLWLVAIAALAGTTAHAQEPWREADRLIEQWNSLERQNATLEARWRERQSLLQLQLELLERERQSLREFITTRRTSSDEVDQKRVQLAEDQVTYEANQESLEEALVGAEGALQSMLPRLPPPLQDMWRVEFNKTSDDDSATPSQRLQSVVTMLSAAIEFDGRVTVHNAMMVDAEDNSVEVRQLYLGLAQGWYVSSDQRLVGYGRAGPDAWQWSDSLAAPADIAEELNRAFEMIENPANAAPVSLPVSLDRSQ